MSKGGSKYILPPLTPASRNNRPYAKFHKFDVPGENDDLNEAMIADETRFEKKNLPEKESVLIEALRLQQKASEERKEENSQLKGKNKELERRLKELEQENIKLRTRLEMKEERELSERNSYERVVFRLLETVMRNGANGQRDSQLDEHIKRLSSELLQQSLDSDGKISTTPPSEPR